MSELCCKPIKTFDNTTRPCIRLANHTGGHNPFSGDEPFVVVEAEQSVVIKTVPELDSWVKEQFVSRMTAEGAPYPEHREKARKMDDKCAEKARARGQMTFTLVEQDLSAPMCILRWIELNWNTCPPDKLRDAFEDALAMQHSDIPKKNAD